jgi:hypothetical protein
MERYIAEEPRNKEVIFPYIGGEDFNETPAQRPSRFVIDFARMPKNQAQEWPALFALLEERVKPVRATNKQRNYREEWWLHANRAEEAALYLQEHGRMLALPQISKHLSVAFIEKGTVAANRLLLFCLHRYADFGSLQSRVHEIWARFVGSSLEDRLSYTTACFDTFPRPPATAALEANGGEYFVARAELMAARAEGFTKIYNRFHDPDESAPDILTLRALHDSIDRATLDAYGWTDMQPTCGFFLDFEEDDDEPETSGGRHKKKPWRHRWSDGVRDEVLARLLDLNAQRAKQQSATTIDAASRTPNDDGKKPGGRANSKKSTPAGQDGLFGRESD